MTKNIIWDFIKKYKISYTTGVFFMILSSYIQSLFPKVLGKIIDILKINSFSKNLVITNILYILIIAAGGFLCTYIWRNLIISNSRRLECELRETFFVHLQKLTSEFYSKRKTGDLIAYAINDISAIRMTFGPAMSMSINGIVLCTASIYVMCTTINWHLTLITLIPVPFIIFFTLNIGKLIRMKFTDVQKSFASISDKVQENIYGIRVIKTYVQEEKEIENFEELNVRITKANLNMVKTSSLLSPAIEFCFSISFAINLIIGGRMVLDGKITLGDFVAFNTYLTMIINPIISIGRVINIYQRGMASLDRLNDILNTSSKIKDNGKLVSLKIKGNIEFKNLDFYYPELNEKSLSGINIKIPKGHTLGIIGKTGSGKSTLVNLLLRIYNVEPQKIFIDGIDINNISLENLRSSFGYVPQDNFLFSSTIKNNITFFKDLYSYDDIKSSTENSCIQNSINSFKDKFNTILGEQGINLSGGQKQRVAIARAIIKDPAVLILDDSLSAVDTITEAEILDNLRNIRKGKTNIIIAHRISAIKKADEIIVLDNGSICERGTHSELLKERGIYYDIYREQYKYNEKEIEVS
ncbi:ABC transporter ATP-binding protein [Clostridium kluyveri]|uniref:ABC transporter ATP-binding protein n=1 Tax=Clostridium kluyveri TaxID=1534 RepID=UPI0022462143|nr:ABC transporter ATP-binding protein [Clostridium kluyveri]UZQ51256.1 ABC transporter ATP-binding protein/permease [Clostridium kluyveri]